MEGRERHSKAGIFFFFLIFWLNLPQSYWGERYFRRMLVVQRHSYCLNFFFLVGEWRVRALGPFSAAWGSSGEPVFLLEEGKKAGRWKFAIKVSNRAGLIFLKQSDCANSLFWSFPVLSSEIIILKNCFLR